MIVQPTAMKNFPPKPKRNNDSSVIVVKENKLLPTKPAEPEVDFNDYWDISEEGIAFNDFQLNTPTMDDYLLIPTTVENDPGDITDTPDTLIFTPELDPEPAHLPPPSPATPNFEDTWNLNEVISPAEAEGREEVVCEFMLPSPTQEVEEVVLPHLMHPTPNEVLGCGGVVVEEFEFKLPVSVEGPNLLLMNNEDNDVVNKSLEENGIDLTSFLTSPMWPESIPDPIASTSTFLKAIEEENPPLNPMVTIKMSDLQTVLTSSSVIDDAAEVDTKDDPEWLPNSEDWNKPSTSSMVYAKKSPIHTVKKPSMKKRPGRPERKEPYKIAHVPSKNDLEAITMSTTELNNQKYRRMRDLNNKASKDCRARRKNKQQDMEMEVEVLTEKNNKLKEKLQAIEAEVAFYRKATSYQ
jgi:hypothetical protein